MKYLITPFNYKKYEKYNCGLILNLKNYSAKGNKYYTHQKINEITNFYKNNKEIFINISAMYTDKQINNLEKIIQKIDFKYITGILISDIGLYFLFLKYNLNNKLIYNPDTLLTNTFDFNLYKNYNFYGAVVAKEITLEQILEIVKKKKYNLFLIGHGYFSMFYSKRKLLSSYNNFYNKKYKLVNSYDLKLKEPTREDVLFPILEDKLGTYVFRANVTNSTTCLDKLVGSIDYFIIDGIFHNDKYNLEILNMYQSNELDKKDLIQQKYKETWDNGFYYEKTIYKL